MQAQQALTALSKRASLPRKWYTTPRNFSPPTPIIGPSQESPRQGGKQCFSCSRIAKAEEVTCGLPNCPSVPYTSTMHSFSNTTFKGYSGDGQRQWQLPRSQWTACWLFYSGDSGTPTNKGPLSRGENPKPTVADAIPERFSVSWPTHLGLGHDVLRHLFVDEAMMGPWRSHQKPLICLASPIDKH